MSPLTLGHAINQRAFSLRAEVAHAGQEALTHRAWPALKRSGDVTIAALVLLVFMPLLVFVALAIKLDSRGPVLYRVRRVGHRGRPLLMLKFRKMRHDADGGPLTASEDPRLTRIGAILTRTRLDELPQLWDVLRGRMSIVGPRPEDPRFVALHTDQYAEILAVRPGITGVSQLAFEKECLILDEHHPVDHYISRILPQKMSLDLLYARQAGPGMDLAVFYWTMVAMLMRRPVAVHRSTGRMNLRRRPVRPRQPSAFRSSGIAVHRRPRDAASRCDRAGMR